MSWPNSWQVQPGYAGYATAAAQPAVAPAAAVAAHPAGYSAMTPEQYAQWQQWQQYQQQYAQWHAQYGEQYARQMGKPLPAVPAPMPIQHLGMPTNVPPPVVAIAQPVPAPVSAAPSIAAVVAPVPPIVAVAPPIPTNAAAPPPPPEPHPDSIVGAAPAPPPPAPEDSEQNQKTAEELAFDEQFRKWEEEFDNWKRKNANHPDKNAYHEYEKKFIECRKKLLERREHLRNKRLAEIEAAKAAAAASASVTSISSNNHQYNQPPPPPPPEEDSGVEVGLFKNALSGGVASGGGIPGLDFINEDDKSEKIIDEEVMEVINLDEENEGKSNQEQQKDASNRPSANPVNALASLLKDPKVSALLNVISGNNNGQGVNLSNLGNHELLQQIQNAAGAVINANQNGNSGPNTPNQSAVCVPEINTPLTEDRSRTSFHDDRRSVVSVDDRSHDFDDFNRGQPPLRHNKDSIQGSPLNRPKTDGFDARVPPPLLGIDLSRPPPPIGSHPIPRPYRSDQPSPAPSNTSSTSRQRHPRWTGENRDVKREPENEPETYRNDFNQRPTVKEEPFNGSDCPPPDENWKYYDGHQDELQIDPELGTPCAVPKPEWMEEEEYEEIYDRYEHIDVFEERKYKMELAIKVLKEKKDREKNSVNQPVRSENDNANVNNSGGSRWQGGMPKPLKEEPGQKRTNPFANDDDYFRPKQVIDYSNGTPQVFDYGHSSSGPVSKDIDERNNDWSVSGQHEPGKPNNISSGPFRNDEDLRMDHRGNDWRNAGNRGQPDGRQPFRGGPPRGGGADRGGRFPNDDFQQPPPQRFDYNHAPPSFGAGLRTEPPPFMDPPHYSVNSSSRLAAMHDNPHPDESNPCYPSKFILMNDNRPNRPSTKRGKRASSIRKQKLREQHDHEQNSFDDNENDHGDIDERQLIPQVFAVNSGPIVERPSDYELDMKRGSEESEDKNSPFYLPSAPIVCIEELLLPPGRFKRPPRICFILRGIPGSGKSYLARLIKDCEVKHGGQAPRVLSIDDYFLVEKEEREPDPTTGRPVLVTKSEYEFDSEMEEEYMKNLIKAFKRTITERLYNFVIVDCVNERLEYYNEFHNFGRSNGFKVFTCTLQTELDMCIEQNIHHRTVDDIRAYANRWALCPNDHVQINASILFNPEETEQPQPTDMDLCTEEDDLPLEEGDQPAPDEEQNEPALDDIDDEDSNFEEPEPAWMASANRHAVHRR
ncbi:YLP motif-containing protein 1-like isoform X2 [Armigeres subalbatus]|uniref:YLP motif-containing protein 1-like isoform X2 n=1 Tax=Armigeres subalbatus TaxID=124917 RepID=UPI002ED25B35